MKFYFLAKNPEIKAKGLSDQTYNRLKYFQKLSAYNYTH